MSTATDILEAAVPLDEMNFEIDVAQELWKRRVRSKADRMEAAENYRGTTEITWEQLFDTPMSWLVQDLLPAASSALLVGKNNMGKTFVYIDMACNVALGRPWLGKETQQSKVLFVLGEGRTGFGSRLAAWCSANNVNPNELKAQVAFIDGANLNNDVSLGLISDTANRIGADLIVFDTYAAASGVISEDDAALNASTLNNARAIRPEATVLFVHHPNKSSEDSTHPVSRGSTALTGAVDLLMTLWKDAAFTPSSGARHTFLGLSTENEHGGKNRNATTETIHGLYLTPCDESLVLMRDMSDTQSRADLKVEKYLSGVMTLAEFMAASSTSRSAAQRYLLSKKVQTNVGTGSQPNTYQLIDH